MFFPATGGKDTCPTVRESICTFHSRRHGLCGTRSPNSKMLKRPYGRTWRLRHDGQTPRRDLRRSVQRTLSRSVQVADAEGVRPLAKLRAESIRLFAGSGSALPTWEIWAPRSATPRGSRSWAPQSVQMRLTDWKRNGACGRPFHGCRTFNAVGKSSCSALDPVVTTS